MTSTGPSPASEGPDGPGRPKDGSHEAPQDAPEAAPKKDAPTRRAAAAGTPGGTGGMTATGGSGSGGAANGRPTAAPDAGTDAGTDGETVYADRVFRSGANVFWGVLMLVVALWLAVDAMVKGDAQTAWVALAGLAFVAPPVIAFLIRPAVYANADRLRIRNPLRTVVLPWAAVDAVRTSYSSEVLAGGAKYQLWAVPVSLRKRKKAVRNQVRAASAPDTRSGGGSSSGRPTADSGDHHLAASDQTVRDLQDLAEAGASRPGARGEISVRWAYELMVPCALGLVALIVLLAS
ncbi:PH domain-containing protein [Streptomyces sp. NPDC058657]|uniref:PH domain-containing protein n=1 Tax=unclassified Streptomyces TaxID=2593676 RepID=UPI0036657B88